MLYHKILSMLYNNLKSRKKKNQNQIDYNSGYYNFLVAIFFMICIEYPFFSWPAWVLQWQGGNRMCAQLTSKLSGSDLG
jgi:hypothetical protein